MITLSAGEKVKVLSYRDMYTSFEEFEERLDLFAENCGFTVRVLNTRKSVDGDIRKRYYGCSLRITDSFKRHCRNELTTNDEFSADLALNDAISSSTDAPIILSVRSSKLVSTDCKWTCIAQKDKLGSIRLIFLSNESNHTGHTLRTPEEAAMMWQNRQIPQFLKEIIKKSFTMGSTATQITDMVRNDSASNFNSSDVDNLLQRTVRGCHAYDSSRAIVNIMQSIDNTDTKGYIHVETTRPINALARVAWCSHQQMELYRKYHEIIMIDTTYCTNVFKMPLILAVTSDNQGTTRIVFQALVSDETTEAWRFFFRQLLLSMKCVPDVVFSDQAAAIAAAFDEELVGFNSVHLLCTWHLKNNLMKRLKGDEDFDTGVKNFMDAVNSTSEESYTTSMESLHSILSTCDSGNKKKHTANVKEFETLDSLKHKWAGYIVCKHFIGTTKSTQRVEAAHGAVKRKARRQLSLTQLTNVLEDTCNKQLELTSMRKLKSIQRIESRKALLQQSSFKDLQVRQSDPISFVRLLLESCQITDYSLKLAKVNLMRSSYLTLVAQHETPTTTSYEVKFQDNTVRQVVFDIAPHNQSIVRAQCSCKRIESIGIPCEHCFKCITALFIRQRGRSFSELSADMLALFNRKWWNADKVLGSYVNPLPTINTTPFINANQLDQTYLREQMQSSSQRNDGVATVESSAVPMNNTLSQFEETKLHECMNSIAEIVRNNSAMLLEVMQLVTVLKSHSQSNPGDCNAMDGIFSTQISNPVNVRMPGRPKTNRNSIAVKKVTLPKRPSRSKRKIIVDDD